MLMALVNSAGKLRGCYSAFPSARHPASPAISDVLPTEGSGDHLVLTELGHPDPRPACTSQSDLARMLGMHQPKIERLESGEHEPSLPTLRHLAEALGEDFSVDVTRRACACAPAAAGAGAPDAAVPSYPALLAPPRNCRTSVGCCGAWMQLSFP